MSRWTDARSTTKPPALLGGNPRSPSNGTHPQGVVRLPKFGVAIPQEKSEIDPPHPLHDLPPSWVNFENFLVEPHFCHFVAIPPGCLP